MDPEIIALVREAVASVVRDLPQGNVDVGFVDDMIRTSERSEVFEGEGLDSVGTNDNKPWTFGGDGWHNTIFQIGLDIHHTVVGANQTQDGKYWLKVDLNNGNYELVVSDTKNFEDIPNGVLGVYIGKIENGKQVEGIYWAPVIYHNL